MALSGYLRMNEDLLHYTWRFRLFDHKELFTQSGEAVEVLSPGEYNTDSGPDFFNARIRIAGTEWAGNIEIHTKASDWTRHGHQSDKAYENIVLHVVYENDVPVMNASGAVPAIELKGRIDKRLIEKYDKLKQGRGWIPCGEQVRGINSITRVSWLERLVVERLARKAAAIEASLKLNRNNWEETFYQHLAHNFGFRTNSAPFGMLARSLPSQVLAKHKSSLLQIEALLFGQAGLLDAHFSDSYPRQLQNEYSFLQKKFSLVPVAAHLWKLMRMRPSNFPTIRIAQFAQLVHRSSHLLSKVLESNSVSDVQAMFDVKASEYWEQHYMFDKLSAKRAKHLGQDSVNNIIINTIAPFLFVYGKKNGDERYADRALKFLEATEGESNAIIAGWKDLDMSAASAWDTQALLQLKNEYCDKKRCLQCAIGTKLLMEKIAETVDSLIFISYFCFKVKS
jgi:hypothetical protein